MGRLPANAMMERCLWLGLLSCVSFIPISMHGTYTHRITCNLYPDQYFQLAHTARQFNSRLAPFVRDAALAHISKESLIPASLKEHLVGIVQEVRRVGTDLHQIALRVSTYQRITHDDLRKAGQLTQMLERQVTILHNALQSLPRDR